MKRTGMIFVLLVFALSLFSGTAQVSKKGDSSKTREKEKRLKYEPVEYDGISYRKESDDISKV
ncbi:MAG: hypothetical protein KAS97_13230, partial [Candidatus Aminicenantes bacterium]|nr:hypothetical protein [Candidatus Aminicenantes bacterium]